MNGGFPAKYYIYTILSCIYIYDSLALYFCDYRFIYLYRLFSCTPVLVIIIYMYLLCICPYMNHCNCTMFFLSLLRNIGLLFTNFNYLASARCSTTKPAIRGLPCTVLITATNLYQNPLCPNSLIPSSSRDKLPQSHSSHKESGRRRKCYSL